MSEPISLPTPLATVLIEEALHSDYDAGMWCTVGAVVLPEALRTLALAAASRDRGRSSPRDAEALPKDVEDTEPLLRVRQSQALAVAVLCIGAWTQSRLPDPTALLLLKSCNLSATRGGPYWIVIEEIARHMGMLIIESYFDRSLSLRVSQELIQDLLEAASRADEPVTCSDSYSSSTKSNSYTASHSVSNGPGFSAGDILTGSRARSCIGTRGALHESMQLNGRLGEALVELREDFDVLLEMIAENKTTGKLAFDNWRSKYPLHRFVAWCVPILQTWLRLALAEEKSNTNTSSFPYNNGAGHIGRRKRSLSENEDVEFQVVRANCGDHTASAAEPCLSALASEDEIEICRQGKSGGDAVSDDFSDGEITVAQSDEVLVPTHPAVLASHSLHHRRRHRLGGMSVSRRRGPRANQELVSAIDQGQRSMNAMRRRRLQLLHIDKERHRQVLGNKSVTTTTTTTTTFVARRGRKSSSQLRNYGSSTGFFTRRFIGPLERKVVTVTDLAPITSAHQARRPHNLDVFMTPLASHPRPGLQHVPSSTNAEPMHSDRTVNLFPDTTVMKSGIANDISAPRDQSSSSEFTLVPRYVQSQRERFRNAGSPIGHIDPRSDLVDTTEVLEGDQAIHATQSSEQISSASHHMGALHPSLMHEANVVMPKTVLLVASRTPAPRHRTSSRLSGSPSAGTSSVGSVDGSGPFDTLGELVRGSIAAVTVGFTERDTGHREDGREVRPYVLERRSPSGLTSPIDAPDASFYPQPEAIDQARDDRAVILSGDASRQSLLEHLGAEIWAAFAP